MSRYKLTVAYDGTDYSGWQVQKNDPSIQATLQKALQTFLRHEIALSGSGRTDAGVHAYGQVAHFDTPLLLDSSKLLIAMGSLLPPDIRVLEIEPVPDDFHARYSAHYKVYKYRLGIGPVILPFDQRYVYQWRGKVDLEAMQKAAELFLGTHDFRAFAHAAHSGAAAKDPVRTMYSIEFFPEPFGVAIHYCADGFLYNMVRNITGMLLSIGTGKRSAHELPHLLSGEATRIDAADTAPARGLYLLEVGYSPLPTQP